MSYFDTLDYTLHHVIFEYLFIDDKYKLIETGLLDQIFSVQLLKKTLYPIVLCEFDNERAFKYGTFGFYEVIRFNSYDEFIDVFANGHYENISHYSLLFPNHIGLLNFPN